MKGVFIIIDGLGDLSCNQLGGKTPLEAAETPNMDFLASRGELGLLDTVRPGFIPESDEAVISLFGNDLIDSSRGQLEARGAGVKLMRGDLAIRANFATIDNMKSGNILDRRAGRTLTTQEAQILAKAINKEVKLPVKFEFFPISQHRGVLVLRGGFSDNISNTDINYYEQGKLKTINKVSRAKPLDEEDNTSYTANILNEFIEKAYEVLNTHSINENRRKKGLLPANFILTRGAGIEAPKLNQYKKWMAIAYMPLEKGIATTSGMEVFSFPYPELKDIDIYENLNQGLKKACEFSVKTIEKNNKKYDYCWIHFKETDLPGHDNKPIEKKQMIETIDKIFFSYLKDFAAKNNVKVVVTADHSTPCKMKAHSADPVPVLFYNNSAPKEKHFNEKEALNGSLGRMQGKELFKRVGFDK